MKKQRLLIIVLIFIIFTCCMQNKIFAYSEIYDNNKSYYNNKIDNVNKYYPKYEEYFKKNLYPYIIDEYDIEMIVNENNIFEITENIEVTFDKPRHGIIRSIPTENAIERVDGTKSKNTVQITDITVDEKKFTVDEKKGYKNIKIGDKNRTVEGRQEYTIKYKYNIGKDPIKNADELYFNLIGTQWDTEIKKVNFKIILPKEFEEEKIEFSIGKKGSINSNNIEYDITGMTITGSTLSKLEPNEGLTIRMTLPEGYFKGSNFIINGYIISISAICVICIFIAFKSWIDYGKDYKTNETIEFYPPREYNSAEVNFLYKGEPDPHGVISLLIYLANNGYLKIEKNERDKDPQSFKIIKEKEYDGTNKYEKMFLNELFENSQSNDIDLEEAKKIKEKAKKNGEKINFFEALKKAKNKPIIVNENIKCKLEDAISEIMIKIDESDSIDEIIEQTSRKRKKWMVIMSYIIFILIFLKPISIQYENIIILFFILVMNTVLIKKFLDMKYLHKTLIMLLPIIILTIISIIFTTTLFQMILVDPSYIITAIIGITTICILLIFFKIMPKRTKYGLEILERINGFKNFLEIAEKSQLEAMIEKNPEYFYEILPYTYGLEMSEKWINKFKNIKLEPPKWYISKTEFNFIEFIDFIENIMNLSANTNISSTKNNQK